MLRGNIKALLFTALLAAGPAGSSQTKPSAKPVEAIVFINSAIPAQSRMVREISHQLYFSQQLKRNITVTFIDINLRGEAFHGPANFLKDKQGVWAEKYRPADIPSMFCFNGKEVVYKKIEKSQEIRKCL